MKVLLSIDRALGRFLAVGTTTVLIDYLCYHLTHSFGIDLSLSKAVGFVSGTVFAYFANRYWTFSAKNIVLWSSIWRFMLVYSVNLGVNVFLNNLFIHVLTGNKNAFIIAFTIATGTSAISNFIGMKYFVFNVSRIK